MKKARECTHCGKQRSTGKLYCDDCRWIVPYANNVAFNHRARATKLGLTEHFTGPQLLELLLKTKQCPCCMASLAHNNAATDHVVPLAKKGKNTIDNIQILCDMCNYKKNTKIIDYRMPIEPNDLFEVTVDVSDTITHGEQVKVEVQPPDKP